MAKPQGSEASPAEHHIVIRDLPGGRFAVAVKPALPEGATFDQEFDTHRQARGFAGGVKLSRGYQLRDLTVFAGGGQ